MDKKQNDLINIIRGFCIFLMMYGHVIQYGALNYFDYFENDIFKIIYSFHMPLLMTISGWCFYYSCKKRNLFETMWHRFFTLIQPIVCCGFFELLLFKILSFIVKGNPFILNASDIKNCLNYFWFLWSVIACSLPIAISFKVTNNKIIRTILLVLLGFVSSYCFPNIHLNMFMYPYFLFGFLLPYYSNYDFLRKNKHIIFYVSLILFILMLFFYSKDHYIYTTAIFSSHSFRQLEIDIFRWSIGLFGCISISILFEKIYSSLYKNKFVNIIFSKFCTLGEKSIKYYTLSIALINVGFLEFCKLFHTYYDYVAIASNQIIYSLLALLIAVLLSYILKIIISVLDFSKISLLLYGK